MTKQELIEATRKDSVTEQELQEFVARQANREKKFDDQARRQKPDGDWYNRMYTI